MTSTVYDSNNFQHFRWPCGKRSPLVYSFLSESQVWIGEMVIYTLIITFLYIVWLSHLRHLKCSLGPWPCTAELSSHLSEWLASCLIFSFREASLNFYVICDVHWLVICNFHRPRSVSPVTFDILTLAVGPCWIDWVWCQAFLFIQYNFHLNDKTLQFRADQGGAGMGYATAYPLAHAFPL